MIGPIALFGVLTVTLIPFSASAQDVPASQRPPCEIAQDEAYAYTREQPVQVGGSPMYGAARQRRYLDALRGPEGQPVTYRRLGQDRAPDGTIIDAYQVTYEGLAKPVTLFLDWYHYNPQRAPRGFTCAQPFNIQPPSLDQFRESDQLTKLSILQGEKREFSPIPLNPDGSMTHGAIYEPFRLKANAARAAAAAGRRLTPATLPKEVAQAGLVVVAYPVTCEGRTIPPRSMTVTDANGSTAPPEALKKLGPVDIARKLPGISIPEGAIAIEVSLQRPRQGDTFEITYAEAGCGMQGDRVALRTTFTPAKGMEMPDAILPDGAEPGPPMLLQVVVDTDGQIQMPEYIGGAPQLVETAKQSLSRWRVEPARANGAPVATGVLLQVRFAPRK